MICLFLQWSSSETVWWLMRLCVTSHSEKQLFWSLHQWQMNTRLLDNPGGKNMAHYNTQPGKYLCTESPKVTVSVGNLFETSETSLKRQESPWNVENLLETSRIFLNCQQPSQKGQGPLSSVINLPKRQQFTGNVSNLTKNVTNLPKNIRNCPKRQ